GAADASAGLPEAAARRRRARVAPRDRRRTGRRRLACAAGHRRPPAPHTRLAGAASTRGTLQRRQLAPRELCRAHLHPGRRRAAPAHRRVRRARLGPGRRGFDAPVAPFPSQGRRRLLARRVLLRPGAVHHGHVRQVPPADQRDRSASRAGVPTRRDAAPHRRDRARRGPLRDRDGPAAPRLARAVVRPRHRTAQHRTAAPLRQGQGRLPHHHLPPLPRGLELHLPPRPRHRRAARHHAPGLRLRLPRARNLAPAARLPRPPRPPAGLLRAPARQRQHPARPPGTRAGRLPRRRAQGAVRGVLFPLFRRARAAPRLCPRGGVRPAHDLLGALQLPRRARAALHRSRGAAEVPVPGPAGALCCARRERARGARGDVRGGGRRVRRDAAEVGGEQGVPDPEERGGGGGDAEGGGRGAAGRVRGRRRGVSGTPRSAPSEPALSGAEPGRTIGKECPARTDAGSPPQPAVRRGQAARKPGRGRTLQRVSVVLKERIHHAAGMCRLRISSCRWHRCDSTPVRERTLILPFAAEGRCVTVAMNPTASRPRSAM
ncbi:hypothetical protein DFJ74DRAFT_721348, partial [Hyaloraphidium curvatum]